MCLSMCLEVPRNVGLLPRVSSVPGTKRASKAETSRITSIMPSSIPFVSSSTSLSKFKRAFEIGANIPASLSVGGEICCEICCPSAATVTSPEYVIKTSGAPESIPSPITLALGGGGGSGILYFICGSSTALGRVGNAGHNGTTIRPPVSVTCSRTDALRESSPPGDTSPGHPSMSVWRVVVSSPDPPLPEEASVGHPSAASVPSTPFSRFISVILSFRIHCTFLSQVNSLITKRCTFNTLQFIS